MADQKQQEQKKVVSKTLNMIHGIRLTRALRDLRRVQHTANCAKNKQLDKK